MSIVSMAFSMKRIPFLNMLPGIALFMAFVFVQEHKRGGAEPGTKQAAYAPGEGGTAGREGGGGSFLSGWLTPFG